MLQLNETLLSGLSSKIVQSAGVGLRGGSMVRITYRCFRQLASCRPMMVTTSLCLYGFLEQQVEVSADLPWWGIVCIVF